MTTSPRPAGMAGLVLATLLGATIPSAFAGRGETLVRTSLLTDATTPHAGVPFRLGVRFVIEPGWHIYWKAPGDSGLATRVKFDLPDGYTAGPLQFPVPTREVLPGGVVNYAYTGEVLLWSTITPPADAKAGSFKVTAKVNWLVCKDVCVPGRAELTNPPTVDAATFADWSKKLPVASDPSHVVSISFDPPADVDGVPAGAGSLLVRWATPPTNVAWFPGPTPGFDLTDLRTETRGETTTIHFRLVPTGDAKRCPIDSVLAYDTSAGRIGLNVATMRAGNHVAP